MLELFLTWALAFKYIIIRYTLLAGGSYLLVYVLLKKQLSKRKIQATHPKRNALLMEVLFSTQTMVIFAFFFAFFFFLIPDKTLFYFNVSDYGWPYLIITFPFMFLIHDTYFYWMHRAIHHPKLFKSIHLVHHKSTNPTPLASYSFHFLESILEALIIPIIAFTLPVHPGAFILFLLMQFIYNVYGHLGYELYPAWFLRSKVGRWINTSTAHNQHHKFFEGNYGLYFLFWDRWMGTLRKDYDVIFETKKL